MRNTEIDHGKVFDWGRASADYAKYRDIYPQEFYQRILDLGLCQAGQKVLDLGTGTGVLPRNLYQYGADFTGIDPRFLRPLVFPVSAEVSYSGFLLPLQ